MAGNVSIDIPLKHFKEREFLESLILFLTGTESSRNFNLVDKLLNSIEYRGEWVTQFHLGTSKNYRYGFGLERILIKSRNQIIEAQTFMANHFLDKSKYHKILVHSVQTRPPNEIYQNLLIQVFLWNYIDYFLAEGRKLELLTIPVFLSALINYTLDERDKGSLGSQLPKEIMNLSKWKTSFWTNEFLKNLNLNIDILLQTDESSHITSRRIIFMAKGIFELFEKGQKSNENYSSADSKYLFIGILFSTMSIPKFESLKHPSSMNLEKETDYYSWVIDTIKKRVAKKAM